MSTRFWSIASEVPVPRYGRGRWLAALACGILACLCGVQGARAEDPPTSQPCEELPAWPEYTCPESGCSRSCEQGSWYAGAPIWASLGVWFDKVKDGGADCWGAQTTNCQGSYCNDQPAQSLDGCVVCRVGDLVYAGVGGADLDNPPSNPSFFDSCDDYPFDHVYYGGWMDCLTGTLEVSGPSNPSEVGTVVCPCYYDYTNGCCWGRDLCFIPTKAGAFTLEAHVDDAGACGADDDPVTLTLTGLAVPYRLYPLLSKDMLCADGESATIVSVCHIRPVKWFLTDNEEGCAVVKEFDPEEPGAQDDPPCIETCGIDFFPADTAWDDWRAYYPPPNMVHRARVKAGKKAGNGLVTITAVDCRYPDIRGEVVLRLGCQTCAKKSGCGPGTPQPKVGSVDITFDLGKVANGESAGMIRIYANSPEEALKREAVQCNVVRAGVTPYYSGGLLQGVGSPEILGASVGYIDEGDPAAGYHIDITPTETYVTTRWDVAPGSTGQVWLSKKNADGSEPALGMRETYLYAYEQNGADWEWHLTYTRGGEQVRLEQASWEVEDPQEPETSAWTKTTQVTQDGGVASTTIETIEPFTWGRSVTHREVATGQGTSLVWKYGYDTSFTGTALEQVERLRYEDRPDGSWTYYEHDEVGRLESVLEPWLDYAVDLESQTPNAASCKETHYTYDTETGEVAEIEERLLSQVVSRTVFVYTLTQGSPPLPVVTERVCLNPAAESGWTYLDTTRTYEWEEDAVGEQHRGRVQSVVYPDGRRDDHERTTGSYSYTPYPTSPGTFTPEGGANQELQTTVYHGRDDGGTLTDVESVDQTVQNWVGNVLVSQLLVPQGGNYSTVTYMVYGYGDDGWGYGRREWASHSNGTLETTVWAECCSDRTETAANGVVTEHTYDPLGRLSMVVRQGFENSPAPDDLTTTRDYDVVEENGVTLTVETTHVVGGTKSQTTYVRRDLAGRVFSETDAAGLTTEYAYDTTTEGGRKVTVIPPGFSAQDPSEVTEYYRDGRVKSATGTGVVGRYHAYGVNTDGTQWTKVATGSSSSSLRWTKTVTDALGRTINEERPAYAYNPGSNPPYTGTVVTSYEYYPPGSAAGQAGHLKKTTTTCTCNDNQLLLEPTLYEYDTLGHLARSGMNLDGVAGLQSGDTDRITETKTFYDWDETYWWRETTSTVYTTDGTAGGKVVTRQRQRLTGFSSSQWSAAVTAESVGTVEYYQDGNPVASQTTTSTTTTDRSAATVTQTVDVADSDTDEETVTVNGLVESTTSRTGLETTFGYDGLGRRTTVTDARDNTTTTTYDPNNTGRVVSVANQNGDTTTYDYDETTGRVNAVGNLTHDVNDDPVYKYTYYAYTPRGEVQNVWGDVPQPVKYHYDVYGQRDTMTTYRVPVPPASPTFWSATDWPGEGQTADTTTWTYDDATGLLKGKQDANNKSVTYGYSPDGRLQSRTFPRNAGGGTTVYLYRGEMGEEPAEPLTGELGGIDYNQDWSPEITFTYDRLGRPLYVTDANANATDHAFNYDDWPGQVSETVSNTYFSKTITRQFDVASGGRLTALAIGTEYVAGYEYEDTGRLHRVKGPGLPDGGTVHGAYYTYGTNVADGQGGYDYAADSDMVAKLEFKNDATTLARTLRAVESQRDVLQKIDNRWRPGVTNEDELVSLYDYRLDREVAGSPGADRLGRRINVGYSGVAFGSPSTPIGQSFGYNERNELIESARDDTSPATTWSYTYDPIGNRTESTYAPAGAEEETTYAPNKLNQYPLWYPPDGPEDGLVLSWDYDGTLLAEFQDLKADMNCDGFVDFDDINPFVTAIISRTTYEAQFPNCEWLNGDLNGDQTVNFDDINPFVAALVGGAVSEVHRSFKWNAEGRLIEYKQGAVDEGDFRAYYEYDYLGRRVYKKVDRRVQGAWVTIVKRRYVWDGWKLLEELDALNSHAVARKFTWGLDLAGQNGSINSLEGAGTIGGLLAVAQAYEDHVPQNAEPDVPAGDFLFFYDGNGNVGQLVAWADIEDWEELELESAQDWHVSRLAAAYRYDPYGDAPSPVGYDPGTQQLSLAGPHVVANQFRFSTKQWDAETALGYWGYRYYSPTWGRWISRDPLEEEGGLNLYVYVHDSPLGLFDPLGRQSVTPNMEKELLDSLMENERNARTKNKEVLKKMIRAFREKHRGTCYYDQIQKPILNRLEVALNDHVQHVWWLLGNGDSQYARGDITLETDNTTGESDLTTVIHELVHAYIDYRHPGTSTRNDEGVAYLVSALLTSGAESMKRIESRISKAPPCPSASDVRSDWMVAWGQIKGATSTPATWFFGPISHDFTTQASDLRLAERVFGFRLSCPKLRDCLNGKLGARGCGCPRFSCMQGAGGADCEVRLPEGSTWRLSDVEGALGE